MGIQSLGLPQMNTLAGLIVEPREHPALRPVLQNICSEVGDIPIDLVHGTTNKRFALEAIPPECTRVSTYQVNADNLDNLSYSMVLTSRDLWNLSSSTKVLVFQTDSGVCANRDKESLNKAMSSDYCGAPWAERHAGLDVGNGGFSLRDRAQMLRLLPEHPTTYNEDIFFAQQCSEDDQCHVCPERIGAQFANETTAHDESWAFHKNWVYRGTVLPNCSQNEKIRDLSNQIPPSSAKVPDVAQWKPTFQRSEMSKAPIS